MADAEAATPQPRYKFFPPAIGFIITNEICERFTYYGLRAILTIFFKEVILYSENMAAVMFHFFVMTAYFFPLIGGIVADSWLGKFRTIMYLSIVYVIGNALLAFISGNYGQATGSNSAQEPVTIIALLLIAIGTGGIKPCVSSFGGEQFQLPAERVQLERFFAMFYLAINFGSVFSTVLTPILREDVKCFGDNSCYPLAFGVPAIFMILALIVFVAGKRFYFMNPPMGNMFLHVCQCVCSAIKNRQKLKKTEKRERWIDYADNEKYDKEFRDAIMTLCRILVLFLPLPMFWALFDQQGSRWVTQAERMDGSLGSLGDIKPDQMSVANPVFLLILLPFMQLAGYPLLARIHLIRTPLQKMTAGGILAAGAFFISSFLEWQILVNEIPKSQETSLLRILNLAPCGSRLKADMFQNEQAVELFQMTMNPMAPNKDSFKTNDSDEPCTSTTELILPSDIGDVRLYFYQQNVTLTSNKMPLPPNSKSHQTPRFAFVFEDGNSHKIEFQTGSVIIRVYPDKEWIELPVGEYSLSVDGNRLASGFSMNSSGVEGKTKSSVHVLWQLPQYFVITLAEVMVSVTGLEFSFTQAAPSMKSVLSAIWLLTVAIGGVLDMTLLPLFSYVGSRVWEPFMFACLMLFLIAIFAVIAMRYKYREGSLPETSSKGGKKGEATEAKAGAETPKKKTRREMTQKGLQQK